MRLVVDKDPKPADVEFLERGLIEFNLRATGFTDGEFLSILLKDEDEHLRGGAYGWVWGSCCYIRYLYLAEDLRGHGHGRQIMQAVEAEALAHRCTMIVLETHSFQAPGFYRKLGFEPVGRVEGYPRGHQYITLMKRLPAPPSIACSASQSC